MLSVVSVLVGRQSSDHPSKEPGCWEASWCALAAARLIPSQEWLLSSWITGSQNSWCSMEPLQTIWSGKLKEGWLEKAAQGCIQMAFEYFQEMRWDKFKSWIGSWNVGTPELISHLPNWVPPFSIVPLSPKHSRNYWANTAGITEQKMHSGWHCIWHCIFFFLSNNLFSSFWTSLAC